MQRPWFPGDPKGTCRVEDVSEVSGDGSDFARTQRARERERDIYIHTHIHVYIYIYTHIYIYACYIDT